MNGLNEHLALLNTIESFFRISDMTSIKGLNTLDVSETKGLVCIKFRCIDRHFPLYSFNVEFQVSREFFEKNLRRLLEVDDV